MREKSDTISVPEIILDTQLNFALNFFANLQLSVLFISSGKNFWDVIHIPQESRHLLLVTFSGIF